MDELDFTGDIKKNMISRGTRKLAQTLIIKKEHDFL